jgi:superfamily II DNA helicase RecQ
LDNLEEMLGGWTESNEMLSVHVQCMSKRICDLCSAAADSRSMSPTKPYHADTSNQSRKEISDLWTSGNLKAIFTTYDCGIDCTSCRGVIFAGGAYGVVGLLQGIGRIRPKQQGPEASVLVLNATVDPRWKATLIKEMKKDAARLVGAGWVESVEQYLSIFGIEVFENWLASNECRMKQLMRLIGKDTENCRRCNYCRGNIPDLRQFHAARAAKERRRLRYGCRAISIAVWHHRQ